jgi:hypothetical protein
MDREGFQFDLKTQRFLTNRWETDVGERVYREIIDGIKNKIEIRSILDPYVLDHDENLDPYRFPYYPVSEITENRFWVLTHDDLRGITVYGEDFSNSPSMAKKSLSYSRFYNCTFSNTKIYNSDLSYAQFEECNLNNAILEHVGGYGVRFQKCSLNNAYICKSEFIECNIQDSNFTGVYLEGTFLEDLKVNHRTKFDLNLRTKWEKESRKTRSMPKDQQPDILRSIRMSYEKAELWDQMDAFLYNEKVAQRKYILWPHFKKERDWTSFRSWIYSLISSFSGYSTKPSRILILGILIGFLYSVIYLVNGTPSSNSISLASSLESLYYSFTTFVTLGYGDISYSADRPYMRLLSTTQALIGAVIISVFVVALARKFMR